MSFTKRLTLGLAMAAAAVLCLAPIAFAGVQGTNHDMVLFGAAKKQGACSQCHVPHKAAGAKLWPSTPDTTGGGWKTEQITPICYGCHGTGNPVASALQVNPFNVSSHGYVVATLTTTLGDIGSLPADVTANLSTDTTRLKCTSCHDVHNNTSRPFLRYTSAAGAYNFQAHCMKCHPNRANVGQASNNTNSGFSEHPVNQNLSDTGVNQANPMQATINAAFTQNPGTGANPSQAGYNLGGHRTNGLVAGPTDQMTCATCHAVHGNETGNFGSADGTGTVGAATGLYTNLLVIRNDAADLTTTDPVCVGCHVNVQTGYMSGPGGANTYSHPIYSLSTAWSVAVNTGTMGYRWGASGGTATIVCQSCHDTHKATANSSILHGALDAAGSNKNCGECHGSGQTAVNHHPSGVVYSGIAAPTISSGAANWATRAKGTTSGSYVFATGNIMTCGTCHGGASDAHNNAARAGGGGFPGLAGYNTTSEMCIDCHTFNPSLYTSVAAASGAYAAAGINAATHFVGTIATTSYQRAANWSSNETSKWGAGPTIICESCHTLRFSPSAVTPRVSNNANFVAGRLRQHVTLLLETSGNDQSTYDNSAGWPKTGTVDMCTGCHGASGASAQGTTHPVLANMTANVTASVLARMATTTGTAGAAASVSVSSNSRINCESCHRPHDAAPGSGALILEGCGTASTRAEWDRVTTGYTDEAVFCNMCHNY